MTGLQAIYIGIIIILIYFCIYALINRICVCVENCVRIKTNSTDANNKNI